MEGPSLYLAQEQLQPFAGQVVLMVSGNSKIGIERLKKQKVKRIFSWAKQLLFQFDDFALRVHFMLYGSFEATVEGQSVTGDYKRTYDPRLVLKFKNGEIKMFACSVRFVEGSDIRTMYDFTADIMSPTWDEKAALKKIATCKDEQIADVLMDQEIFGGVGNIIKNEVLFIRKINPKQLVKNLSAKELKSLTQETQKFSHQFYAWRKKFELKKHYQIYRKSVCIVSGTKIIREQTGRRMRRSFYCPHCQSL